MSTEFFTMKESEANHKGSIRGVIIKQGELKGGTGRNGDWTMKTFTIEDNTGQLEITCWNTEIGRLKVGEYYEIENPWWKERADKPGVWNLGLGDYCKVTKVDNPPTQTTMETPEAATGQIRESSPKPEATRGEVKNFVTVPEGNFLEYIIKENKKLAQISKVVTDEMQRYLPATQEPRGDIIGLRTKEIYRSWKNFHGNDD